ncbi:PREDICTED: jasmonate O-methyltransferase-like [Camelina sativa]|uniref:Jasmonate O-methyltransferase-like n=1 Tax=Camelina sativa TaxID=90675 RepID=A0ABM0Z4C6_CAMSA|nr:PREDICTED: jasmonate O-methyltransferase-like [Camelina sativa]
MDEALKKLMISNAEISSIGIADLGCSTGPNSLFSISNIIDTIQNLCLDLDRPVPEFRVSLNDLPSNDFNHLFASLAEFYNRLNRKKDGLGLGCGGGESCFVSAVPGTFHGRLFPRRSLHFVHSSSSLHWLSQVPCREAEKEDGVNSAELYNVGKIYISKTSPKSAHKAYALQFQTDFSAFLESRSKELVPGGRMFLSLFGRSTQDPTTDESCYQWELLAQALISMAKEGIIEEEKINAFNTPYYAASSEELIMVIEKEGSFLIDRLEISPIDWEGRSINEESYDLVVRSKPESLASRRRFSNTIRAVAEPMLEPMFGENVMDELFERYAKIVGEYLYVSSPRFVIIILSLVRTG